MFLQELYLCFPVALVVNNLPANCRRYKRLRFDPWIRKNPWRRKWQPTLIFLPGKSMDRETWRAVVHRVAESQA